MRSNRHMRLMSASLILIVMLMTVTGCDMLGIGDSGSGVATEAAELQLTLDSRQTEQAPADQPEQPTAIPPTLPPPTEPPPTKPPDPTATPLPPPMTVLVVIDDGLSGHPEWTSGEAIGNSLDMLDQDYDTWSLYSKGVPTVSTLAGYDVVYWTLGDDCCDTPTYESTQVIQEYQEQGGNLFIDGGSVAYAWKGNFFLEHYLGADNAGYGPLSDLVTVGDHPLTAGFETSIALARVSAVRPDAIAVHDDADVIFERGSASTNAGKPAVLAVDGGQWKTVYVAFPLYWFAQGDVNQLVDNAMGWFGG